MTRAAIESTLLDWMREPAPAEDPARFEALALALFAWQYDHCEPYARYARALGRTPDDVGRSDAIPAVPTGAFKEFALRGFPAEDTVLTFRTSGTSVERRGTLELDTVELYEASLLASLRRLFLTDLTGRRPRLRFLAPPPSAVPDSSLTHMFETLRRAEGHPESGFDWRDDGLDLAGLTRAIEAARAEDAPIVLAGTAFAFVHLLDEVLEGWGGDAGARPPWLALPRGSRVMETGGFKGRSREVPRDVLRSALAEAFALPETSIVNQYGMTELGSQFYDSTLVDPEGPRRKLAPPWTRVRLVDPESLVDVADGEVGLIVIHDLANTGSVAAIQTADLGRALLDDAGRRIGFDVLGRGEGAEARGCSIAADVMLEAAGGSA